MLTTSLALMTFARSISVSVPRFPSTATKKRFRVIRPRFSYVFDDKPTLSTVPSVKLNLANSPFELLGIPFIPLPMLHGDMEVLGFSLRTRSLPDDFSKIPDSSWRCCKASTIWFSMRCVTLSPHAPDRGIRHWPSSSSSSLARVVHSTSRTNLPHAETNDARQMGFPHVQLAYDGLQI